MGSLKRRFVLKSPRWKSQAPNPPNGGLKKKIPPKVPQMGDLGGEHTDGGFRG